MSPVDPAVEARVAALADLNLKALQAQWRDLFKCPPPKGMRSNLLRRAVAYRIQEQAYGGLSKATRRRLQQLASATGGRLTGASPSPAARLRPGVRLMREWQGETHIVDVLADGFRWRSGHYRSLSAVANAITGSRWSGVRFFGLHESPAAEPAPMIRQRHRKGGGHE